MAKMNIMEVHGGTFLLSVWVMFLLVSTLIQPGDFDEGKLFSVTLILGFV